MEIRLRQGPLDGHEFATDVEISELLVVTDNGEVTLYECDEMGYESEQPTDGESPAVKWLTANQDRNKRLHDLIAKYKNR